MSSLTSGLRLRRTAGTRSSARPVRKSRPAKVAPAPIQPGGPQEKVAVASSVLTMIAVVSLWFLVQVLFLSGFSAERQQRINYDHFRQELAAATAPTGPVVPVGTPVALLSIPSLGLQQVVTEGTASGDLLGGPGHRRDTVIPGQKGVSVVYGRAATYGAPFKRISELQPKDRIVVQSSQGLTVFRVDAVRRAGDKLTPPPTAEQARITLVSAQAHGRLAALQGSEAIFVDATAKKGFDFPAGRPLAVPASEKAMANDPGALPMLALVLGLLVALTYAVIQARRFLSTTLVWVMASPVAVALAWFTTDQVMRLLPNLL